MSRVDSHEHSHHIEGSIAETSLDSPDNVTFDYTNVNGATASQAVVSTDEFDITFLNKNEVFYGNKFIEKSIFFN